MDDIRIVGLGGDFNVFYKYRMSMEKLMVVYDMLVWLLSDYYVVVEVNMCGKR